MDQLRCPEMQIKNTSKYISDKSTWRTTRKTKVTPLGLFTPLSRIKPQNIIRFITGKEATNIIWPTLFTYFINKEKRSIKHFIPFATLKVVTSRNVIR